MRCGSVKRQLTPYLDDRLDAEARAAVEAHLPGCPACAEELRLLRNAGHVLRAEGPAAVPDGLAARLAAGALAGRREGRAAPAAGLAGLLESLRWPALATAAAAVTLALGLTVAMPRSAPSAPSARDAVAGLLGADEAELDRDFAEAATGVLGLEEE